MAGGEAVSVVVELSGRLHSGCSDEGVAEDSCRRIPADTGDSPWAACCCWSTQGIVGGGHRLPGNLAVAVEGRVPLQKAVSSGVSGLSLHTAVDIAIQWGNATRAGSQTEEQEDTRVVEVPVQSLGLGAAHMHRTEAFLAAHLLGLLTRGRRQ